MSSDNTKRAGESQKRLYSDEEIASIYELGRFFAENGDLHRAETVWRGLVAVAPDFAPAWLGLSFIHCAQQAFDSASQAARQALKLENGVVGQLFLATTLMCSGDFNTAGTLLGEVAEKVEAGAVEKPDVVRFFKIQLARFENRQR